MRDPLADLRFTGRQFKAWRKRHFRSQEAARIALGKTIRTITLYESDEWADKQIPRAVMLACAHISLVLESDE